MAAMGSVGKIAVGLTLGVALISGGLGQAMAKAPMPAAPAAAEADSLDSRLKQSRAQSYRYAMLAGYSAAERQDYNTALINFRRALAARPGDRYATAAIRNMETYLARERAEAAKLAEIEQRQATLAEAVAASDWACAAASVDRLVVLIPPASADRARLIAYRGELTGFIQSRANLDQWSTVCPGGQT
ncbi:hypothetical protein IQ273_31540 [Nodosilinea sp. LEGE 07298]|uniref:hypothetical protein n=1 Tax=Nodosilinea sp. LEGE 07298 TaxID=2777970 RepID=UPI0018806A56|nr:hypothetical protein [Nodosilinea sp. LEGE 07298]MBE9113906.1 hypothetical protein [Nodosilinea sp. LEGE 07298]